MTFPHGDRLCLASLEFRVELRPGEADSSGRRLQRGLRPGSGEAFG
jgi:hypothetical protein